MAVIPGGDAFAAAQNALATTAPATRFAAVTAADTDFSFGVASYLIVGGAGTVVVCGRDDTDTGVTINAVAGQTIPGLIRRVRASSNATGIVAAY